MSETIRPAFLVTSNNRDGDPARGSPDTPVWAAFVIELGDVEQFHTFDAFVEHVRGAAFKEEWDDKARLVRVEYKSGSDTLGADYSPDYKASGFPLGIEPGEQSRAFRYRTANGRWPYLPAGIDRETNISIQGTTGELRKNGATLKTEPGHVGYLIADPAHHSYIAYNPLPDPATWALQTPEGIRVSSQGKVGLLRVHVDGEARTILIDSAVRPGSTADPGAIEISGVDRATRILHNGRLVPTHFAIGLANPVVTIPLGEAEVVPGVTEHP